ncbi:MAG: hypothetical protein ACR2PQ_04965 [Myxococcota bacterium]
MPVGLSAGAVSLATGRDDFANDPNVTFGLADLLLAVIWAAGCAAVAVVLSRAHTRMPGGNPWGHVAARFLPWATAWALSAIATVLGFVMLIIPGIIVGTRLFWADEFALIHRQGPIASIRQSLDLTKGVAGRVFGFQFALGFASYVVWIPLIVGFVAASTALGQLDATPLRTLLLNLGMAVLGLHGYAAFHAPEVAYFYGLRALREATPEEDRTGDWVARALRGKPA